MPPKSPKRAKAMGCRFNGCGREGLLSRGLCSSHYTRAKREKLLDIYPRTRRAENGAPLKFLTDNVGYSGADCVLWPFARAQNGYPELRYRGKSTRAHRLMCQMAHGEPPASHYEASHTCDRGHLGCVNPRHLVWETHADNHRRRTGMPMLRSERSSGPTA